MGTHRMIQGLEYGVHKAVGWGGIGDELNLGGGHVAM